MNATGNNKRRKEETKKSLANSLPRTLIESIAWWIDDIKSLARWFRVNRNNHLSTQNSTGSDNIWKTHYLRHFEQESADDPFVIKSSGTKTPWMIRYRNRRHLLIENKLKLDFVFDEIKYSAWLRAMDSKYIYFGDQDSSYLETIELKTRNHKRHFLQPGRYPAFVLDSQGSLATVRQHKFLDQWQQFGAYNSIENSFSTLSHPLEPISKWTFKEHDSVLDLHVGPSSMILTEEWHDCEYVICLRNRQTGQLIRSLSWHNTWRPVCLAVDWNRNLICLIRYSDSVQVSSDKNSYFSVYWWLYWIDLTRLVCIAKVACPAQFRNVKWINHVSISFDPCVPRLAIVMDGKHAWFVDFDETKLSNGPALEGSLHCSAVLTATSLLHSHEGRVFTTEESFAASNPMVTYCPVPNDWEVLRFMASYRTVCYSCRSRKDLQLTALFVFSLVSNSDCWFVIWVVAFLRFYCDLIVSFCSLDWLIDW